MAVKKLLFLFLFFGSILAVPGQDLIIFKDGRRISCRVLEIDSSNIVYRTGGSHVSSASRDMVQRYFLSRKSENRLSKPGAVAGSSVHTSQELILFSAAVGLSNPTGEYASVSVDNEKAGFATRGVALDIGAVFKLNEVIGLKAMFRSQSNKFAADPFCSALEAAYPGLSFSCVADKWTLNGLFGGLSLRFPVGNSPALKFTVDGDAGVPRIAFPDLSSTAYQGGGSATVSQSAFPATSFAWSVGAGISYEMAENVAVRLFAEFIKSVPKYAVGVYLNGSLVEQYSYEQIVTAVNVGVGLTIIIPKK